MVRLILALCAAVLLVACGGGGDGLPTQVPTADVDAPAAAGDESPRATPPSGLPPTWTPAPSPSPLPATPPAAPAPGGQPAPAPGQQSYEVQAGDTLAEIAARFNVSLDALAAANGITNPDHIEVGQVLIIP